MLQTQDDLNNGWAYRTFAGGAVILSLQLLVDRDAQKPRVIVTATSSTITPAAVRAADTLDKH